MRVSIIVAVSENNVIGQGKSLPWHISADMKHFKRLTMGKPVVMGRKTFQTLKQPLSGRKNIILTRQEDFATPGCTVVHSLEEALEVTEEAEEIMIAGGAAVYRLALPVADRIYMTRIHASFNGDTFFPAWNRQTWREVEREDHPDTDEEYTFSYITYEKIPAEQE